MSPADLDSVNIDKTQFLTDDQIQKAILGEIKAGYLQSPIQNGNGAPDLNRLYVVFVEPGVAVQNASGSTSVSFSPGNFLGYHSAFGFNYPEVDGSFSFTGTADVHYAVIVYNGSSVPLATGTVTNAIDPSLSTFDNITMVTSHELAEAVTDPDIGYKNRDFGGPSRPLGWNDNALGEVGDVANSRTVYLNGYAVQRIGDPNDAAMTPRGATSAISADFVLKADGTFWVHDQTGFTEAAANVASISDQSVDNFGQPMVDVVFTNGSAAEYHEFLNRPPVNALYTVLPTGNPNEFNQGGNHWVTLTGSNVKQAKAGQGVSYVLMNDGTLHEYFDNSPVDSSTFAITFAQFVDSNVQSIDAGTDQHGVNMVTEVRTDTFIRYFYINGRYMGITVTQSDGYEFSDSTGKHWVASYVSSMSAGQQGEMAYLTTGGAAYLYSESGALATYLNSGVSAVTVGTDANGNYMIDLLFANGSLSEWRQWSGWTSIASGNVTSIGKAHAGVLDAVFSADWAWTHTSAGWTYLTSGATTAA
jgi:hypothetical protein